MPNKNLQIPAWNRLNKIDILPAKAQSGFTKGNQPQNRGDPQCQTILKDFTNAWENEASAASFGGMTLAQFKAAVKPSLDARDKVAAGEQMAKDGANERDDADVVSNQKIALVVNAVKGDPNFGENSDLYEAMGYVRKSERKTGLTRKKKDVKP